MLGLGLSLFGGAVMETPQGATAFFPAESVFHTVGNTLVSVQTPNLYNIPEASWEPSAVRARFRIHLERRGARHATTSFGYLSRRASTLCAVFISSRLFSSSNGNASYFQYSPVSLSYTPGTNAASFAVLAGSSGLGIYELNIANNSWRLNQFGTLHSGDFGPVRLPYEAEEYMYHALFGMTTVSGTFYGSYIMNTTLGVAYQCHPMKSAGGKAALYETTTKQLVTDATLSAK